MRWIFRVAIGLVALVVVVVGGLVVFISTSDFSAYRTEIASAVKSATGRDLKINGTIEQKTLTLSPSIVVTDVAFSNAKWGTSPHMMTAARIELEVKLLPLITGTIEVKRFRLIGANILLETNAKGQANWQFLTGDKPAGSKTSGNKDSAPDTSSGAPKIKDVLIRDSFFTFRDGRSGLVSKVKIKEIAAVAPTFDSKIALTTRGTYNGVSIATDGTLGRLGDLIAGVKGYPIAMKVQFGKSELQFAVKADMSSHLPRIEGGVESSLLDLDEIAAATAQASGKKAAPTKKKPRSAGLFPKDELPLGILGMFNANLKVRLKRLVVAGNHLEAVRADVSVNNGKMVVKDFSTRLTNGEVAGQVTLDVSTRMPKVAANLRASRISLGKVLRQAIGQALIGSYATVRVNISGSGRSVHGIVSTLRSPVVAVLGSGPIASELFNIASTDLLSLISLKPGRLHVVCGVFALRFNGRGVGSGRRLVLDTNRVTFSGSGSINLPRERMSFHIVPAGKGVSLTQLARVFPILITGRLTRPSVRLDTKAIPKQVLEEALGIVELPFDAAGALFGSKKGKARRGCGARASSRGGKPKGLLKNLRNLNPFKR